MQSFFRQQWLIAFLTLQVVWGQVKTHTKVPQPNNAIYARFLNRYYETDELWRFTTRTDYESLIQSQIDSPLLREQMKSLYQDHITALENVRASIHYYVSGKGGYVFVPLDLRAQLPRKFLSAVYKIQKHTSGRWPDHLVLTASERELIYFIDQNFSGAAKVQLRENMIEVDGQFLIPMNPYVWGLVPDHMRRQELAAALAPHSAAIGVSAKIVVSRGDDLALIARRYAAGRDYRAIERYLRIRLGSKSQVEVGLEKILPPFIRKMVDTFSDCHGPDCSNAVLNVNRSYHYKMEYICDDDFVNEINLHYKKIESQLDWQVGDLLVYQNNVGDVVHVSAYVGDDLVFTKNGHSKFSPYLIQLKEYNESLYFPDQKFLLSTFRPQLLGGHSHGQPSQFSIFKNCQDAVLPPAKP